MKDKTETMKAHVIYKNYLNPDGDGKSVGGIQTYIDRLIPVLVRRGYEVYVHQIADSDFLMQTENATVYGYGFRGSYRKLARFLYGCAEKQIDPENDLVIFGNEALVVRNRLKRSIGIQHGISWDKPLRSGCSKPVFLADYVLQCIESWKTVNRIKRVKKLVCVDYNFVNWYRALVAHPETDIVVTPNFSQIPVPAPEKDFGGRIGIIFARRFFDYRGTRIFAGAIRRILSEYDGINITVAGEGPDEEYLHKSLDGFANVDFIRYRSEDSLSIHADKHIAVVPTLGSEGTSLSLIEAMASRCAAVCTNVGGMTNLVIDGYNGLMIQPNEEELYRAIKALLDDRETMERLADTAYQVAKSSFSLPIWEKRWEAVFDSMEIAE